MDDPLILEVFDRLDGDVQISGTNEDLVLGALFGRLSEVIDGVRVDRPAVTDGEEPASVRAYLESVAVTGFRGIGPKCELRLQPGPGLTLVVGRNGSGKSSLAEAVELALTGDALRWSGKTKDWKSGWRNLHAVGEPRIEVGLRVDGERAVRTVRVRWNSDDLESAETLVTVPGQGRQSLDLLGWSAAVCTFRPFLSYTELSTIIEGRPVDRYNALAPMLGMESLQAPIGELRQARLSSEKQLAAAKGDVVALVGLLRDCPDDRAGVAVEALEGTWDIAKLESLITGNEPAFANRDRLLATLTQLPAPDIDSVAAAAIDLRAAEARLEGHRGTDADHAERLAGLLQAAADLHEQHGDADCPVCGRGGGLRSERVAEMREEIDRLRSQACAVVAARKAAYEARLAAQNALGAVPQVLGATIGGEVDIDLSELKAAWSRWIDAPMSATDLATHLDSACLPVVEATQGVRAAAARRQQELADQWRPIAERLAEVIPVARAGQSAQQRITPLSNAERWLKRCEAAIRDERFDKVKTQVKQVWATLAVDSNVTLEDVRFGTKKVDMDVTVDGDSSAALGVMSQGELHALALSLFIPRVTCDDSPFGFAMLDDPVQAMDPVRVDRLAHVLQNLAQTRQVVVFTHDDRLPSAIRRLQIPASILSVTRRPRSEVELECSLDPVHAAINDARALRLSEGLPDEVARRVIPALCRQAIESACLEAGRRRLLATGLSHVECEKTLADAVKLLPRIAIALHGDADRAGDVYRTLDNKFGREASNTVRDCNQMAHTGADESTDLKNLINRAESLAEKLAAL